MKEKELRKRVAKLETMNDHLLSELNHVDQLMRLIGFAEGLETVKQTAKDMTESEDELEMDSE